MKSWKDFCEVIMTVFDCVVLLYMVVRYEKKDFVLLKVVVIIF